MKNKETPLLLVLSSWNNKFKQMRNKKEPILQIGAY